MQASDISKVRVTRIGRGGLLGCAAALLAFACSGESEEPSTRQIREKLESEGFARVSVVLAASSARAAAAAAQNSVELSLSPASRVVHKFKSGPGMSVQIGSADDLVALATHPDVLRVDLTPTVHANLDDSREIVGANAAFDSGFTGAGRVVAVIDSGIANAHDDLVDNVLDEACFCGTPCCPNGTDEQFGVGAADDDNGHGTHVSGIITSAGTGPAPRGVAPDTDIVAVKVLDAAGNGFLDDTTAALEWIDANYPEVDAVNMSLGSNLLFGADCDLEPSPPAFVTNMANAVAALRSNGVLSISSSGNNSSKEFMTAPACISDVVAVGNTTKANVVWSTSNSNEGLDIVAPGTFIVSSFPPNTTASYVGTSQASPHVAAAAALLLEGNPDLDEEEVLDCLLTSDTQITDPVNGIVRPLLDIPAAFEACGMPLADDCNAASYEAETMFHSTGGSATGGWNIWSNGYISTSHDFTAGPASITVQARGELANGVAPHMVVSVGGSPIGNVSVSSSTYAPYTFNFTATAGSQEIRVAFDNDLFAPPQDRNLIVDSVSVDCVEPGSNPCASQCENPTAITWSGSYQSGALGTGERCFETTQPIAGGNCGHFIGGRQLTVNGTTLPCTGQNWASIPAAVNGGYCIEVTPGNQSFAFMTLW
jgi:subtilisin family serine protease